MTSVSKTEMQQDHLTLSGLAGRMIQRRRGVAVLSVLSALVVVGWFARTVPLGEQARFRLTPAVDSAIEVADLVLPVGITLYTCALILLLVAVGALFTGEGPAGPRSLSRVPGAVWIAAPTLAFVTAFLTWAVAGQSLSLIGMLQGALVGAVPIMLAALSGLVCERAGVVNIAIEGMMLSAAFTAVIAASLSGSQVVGVLVGILTGALMALFHAHLSIAYRVNQIVSGTVVNIMATGMTSYLSARFLQQYGWLNHSGTVAEWSIPGLAQIPVIGPLLFANSPFFFAAIALVVVLQLALFRTRFGLRVRAVGEHPRAADTLGIDVYRVRYLSVVLGGAIAGLGGAFFTVGSVGRFDEVMTAGKGFIGLAAMIFGKWTPVGSMWASLLFGFADSLQTKLQILFIPIPSEFLLMVPYLITMVVISGLVGRAVPPAADGEPYDK